MKTLAEIKKYKIGIFCGGPSNEKEVSLRSGKNVYRILKDGGYNVLLIEIESREDIAPQIMTHGIQIIFNTLHGYYGEDGQFQGDLNYLGINYTGSGTAASALGMNKLWTKLIAHSLGIPTAKYVYLEKGSHLPQIEIPFSMPWFIKPVLEGSSRDSHIVKTKKDKQSLKLEANKSYLIEELIVGEEVTSGILSAQDEALKLPILKLVAHNEFYDYEAKYTAGKTDFICPAPLTEELTEKIQAYSFQIQKIIGCNGASRCDYIIQASTGVPYFLEINTSPGMTELSDIPIEGKALGLTELEICEWILRSSIRNEYAV